jgi:hypothetical protein
MVAQEFGEVDVRQVGDSVEVLFTILMETAGEGWQTGMAIDASRSMEPVFGKSIASGPKGKIPYQLFNDYLSKGWVQMVKYQGKEVPDFGDAAKVDLVAQGYAVWSQNEVQPFARRMAAYLASKLDADGGTTVIYWACGDGKQIEEVGDLRAEECESASFVGPIRVPFGNGTHLTPAMQYFVDRFRDAPYGMYIFVTDGELHDLEEVKRYTIGLCQDIQAQRRNPLKCVLIGVGSAINESQMEELDDLESGTDVDIWDHKIAKDMRSLAEIFAEVVSEHQIVAESGRIYDASAQLVKYFSDGLPARVKFTMPATSQWFELEVPGQARIRQWVVLPEVVTKPASAA